MSVFPGNCRFAVRLRHKSLWRKGETCAQRRAQWIVYQCALGRLLRSDWLDDVEPVAAGI